MFKRSLAVRIFAINIILLTVPMLILLGIFFQNDKESTLTDVLYHLRDLGWSRTTLIYEDINFRRNMLTLLIHQYHLNEPDSIKQEDLTFQFKKLVNEAPGIENITYCQKNAEGRFIIWSSSYYDPGEDVSGFSFIEAAIQQNEGVVFGFGPTGLPWMFVTKTIVDASGNLTGTLTIALDTNVLVRKLLDSQIQYNYFDMHFSLLTKEGVIFTSSDPLLSMVSINPLSTEVIDHLFQLKEITKHNITFIPSHILDSPPFRDLIEYDEKFLQLKKTGTSERIGLLIPIESSNSFFMIDVSREELLAGVYSAAWKSVILLISAALVAMLVIWLLVKRFSKPLKELIILMRRVEDGDYKARYVNDDVGYEINLVGQSINRMLNSLIAQIELVKTEQIKQEMFAKELKIGHQIQQRILPQQLPVFGGISIATLAKPALEVGGDYYDVFVQKGEGDKKKLLITIADTSGKGISACLYSLVLRSMMRSYATSSKEVGVALKNANNLFCLDTTESAMFVTVFAGILDPDTKQFDYYSAGHLPALVKHADGTIDKLWTPGTPLGIAHCDLIEQKTTTLQEGDILLLYTDGITEAMNRQGDLFGDDRLMEFLKTTTEATPQLILDNLIAAIEKHAQGAEQYDDITAVIIKIE